MQFSVIKKYSLLYLEDEDFNENFSECITFLLKYLERFVNPSKAANGM